MKNKKNKVAIIGFGYVGRGMGKIFPDALIYDPNYKESNSFKEINDQCGLAIVCVPTPPVGMKGEQRVEDTEDKILEVDLSFIEQTFDWLKVPNVLIKSTVPPGTTDSLIEKYDRNICFSPEYMGEGGYYTPPKYPDPTDARKHDFMVIGGESKGADAILVYFKEKLGPAKIYYKCTAVEAECIKYMENNWGATKVIFFNEWYEMCQRFGASFNSVREGFLLDSRTEQMHSTVFENKRGFGGKCYPKDLLGIIAASEKVGYEPKLLKSVWEVNKDMLKLNL